jgi:hypothetical protein
MALEFSRSTVLSTDKRYFFLEDEERESNGYDAPDSFHLLFLEYREEELTYELGEDTDPRFPLIPSKLLTFNNDTETEE